MRLLLIALLLSGCAHSPTFTDRTVTVRMIITDEDLRIGDADVVGIAQPLSDPCLVMIERSHYFNEIIAHEIRHCFEGYWHELIHDDTRREELNQAYESKFK